LNLPDDFELWTGQSPLDLVADFHQVFAPDLINTNVIDADIVAGSEARIEFLEEEMDELRAAFENRDPVEFTDAIVDLMYFLYGTALSCGIPIEEAFAEVHATNMAKANPDGTVTRDPRTNKVLKPEGWQAPDLAAVLQRARERGSPFTI
jgi:predicted HAD superfamily Cof-like phosphohydrolase